MRQRLIFKTDDKEYEINKYYFQKDKKPIKINDVDIEKIVLSNKAPYGKHGANKHGFKPLCINIKNIKLYINRMNVLAYDNELLRYIEIWIKIETLFNEVILYKKGFHYGPIHNKYIRVKISS